MLGVYNPVTPAGLFKLNYRMHDKYVIVDDEMYLLGGRNSNDIFLGDYTTDINVDQGYSGVGYQQRARENLCRNWKRISGRYGMRTACK